jgi:hypothetical protein
VPGGYVGLVFLSWQDSLAEEGAVFIGASVKTRETQLSVKGMTCASCVANIERSLKKKRGLYVAIDCKGVVR